MSVRFSVVSQWLPLRSKQSWRSAFSCHFDILTLVLQHEITFHYRLQCHESPKANFCFDPQWLIFCHHDNCFYSVMSCWVTILLKTFSNVNPFISPLHHSISCHMLQELPPTILVLPASGETVSYCSLWVACQRKVLQPVTGNSGVLHYFSCPMVWAVI